MTTPEAPDNSGAFLFVWNQQGVIVKFESFLFHSYGHRCGANTGLRRLDQNGRQGMNSPGCEHLSSAVRMIYAAVLILKNRRR